MELIILINKSRYIYIYIHMQIIGKHILKFSFPHINLNRMLQLMINIQSNQASLLSSI